MARSADGINRSSKIREVFEELGLETTPAEVVRRLGEQNVTVSPTLVYLIKARLRNQRNGGGRQQKRRAASENVSVADVVVLRQITQRIGAAGVRRIADAFGG